MGFNLKIFIYGCVVAVLAHFTSIAQNYNFTFFSVDEGLSQSEVNCIFEDSRGFLWLGTSGGGVCKFDGHNFTTYEEKDGLSGQIVTDILEDKDGTIWISSTWGGLSKFNGITFDKLGESDGLPRDNISDLELMDDNSILATVGGNLVCISKDKIKNYRTPIYKNKKALIIKIKKDRSGNIWLATTHGVWGFKDGKFFEITGNDMILGKKTSQICEDKLGNIYFLCNESEIFQLKKTPNNLSYELFNFKLPKHLTNLQITNILVNFENDYMLATREHGVLLFKNDVVTNYSTVNGLRTNQIKCLFEDKNKCLWIGTSGQGLVKFVDLSFTYFDSTIGFKETDIFAITCDSKNNIWAASYSKGLYMLNEKKEIVDYSKVALLQNFGVRTLYHDRKGVMWIGGKNGLVQYKNNSFSTVLYQGKEFINVRRIFEDSDGKIWIATQGSGVFVLNNGTWEIINEASGLKNLNVYSFCEKNKKIYIGTGWGFYEYSNKKAKRVGDKNNELCNQYIGSMLVDNNGVIWLGTDKCVINYDGKKFNNISIDNGLSSSTIYSLIEDTKGNVWSGNTKGVDKIVTASGNKIISIKGYGRDEGFKGIECNTNAALCDNEGNLWFGTVKGIIKYNPYEEKFLGIETPVVNIDKIKLFYEEPDWKKYATKFTSWNVLPIRPVLPHNQNNITIYFSAINKVLPNNIQYSFMLENFDKEWSPLSLNNSSTYSNLPPGFYVFKVKARNKEGNWSSTSAQFEFEIKQAFWQTIWFKGIIVLLLIGAVYAFDIIRKRRLKQKEKELIKLVDERTTLVLKQKEEIEVLLKEVHHRVKNNLQIISSLLSLQSNFLDDKKAIKIFEECRNRIHTMALVHETLYRTKDFEKVDVKNYIESLTEILLRIYSVNAKVTLRTNITAKYLNLNTIIPLGLLLNEIISNSLKYAFVEQNKGSISIDIHKVKPNTYELEIADDGVGFDTDIEDDQSNSLGLELVKIFTEQLNGKIEKVEHYGTKYRLEFQQLKN